MKTHILACLLFLISIQSYSQSAKIDAQIILTSEDTLNVKFKVPVNIFYRDLIEEPSFNKKLTICPENNPNYKIYAKDIKMLSFTDLRNQERVFKSTNDIKRIDKKNKLIEVKIEGKISWYRYYFRNFKDQSVTYVDYFVKKDKPIESIGAIRGIKAKRKIFYEFIKLSTIDLSDEIEELQTPEDVISFIEMYNNMD